MDVDKATSNHLRNVETRYGKSLTELADLITRSGLVKFGEKREFLKTELGMSHGDANAVINHVTGNKDVAENPLGEIYVGKKAALLPLHEQLMTHIQEFGEFETAPKKGYVSLRRKKQFAMIGPATNTHIEVGLFMKGVPGTPRLIEQAPGGMCQYKVRFSTAEEIDGEFLGWVRASYDSAG